MNSDIKTGIGFLIPAGALVGFVLSMIAGNYLLGTLLAVTGILGWFIYMAVMETSPPTVTGNVIILFGFLLSLAVFLNYGWEQNMFGGFMFRTDGSILALIILLFSILLGVVYRRYDLSGSRAEQPPLSEEDLALVKKALAEEGTSEKGSSEPKVIVVKQEAPKEPEPEPEEYEYDYNAAYAYPPEYYYDDENDYDEDEYEDEEE